jgi:hypothetical protein
MVSEIAGIVIKINTKKKYKIMALNIKPLSDRVLIEPVAAETKLLQGFYSRYSKRKTTKRNCCCS